MEKGPPDLDWWGCGSKGELAVTRKKKRKKKGSNSPERGIICSNQTPLNFSLFSGLTGSLIMPVCGT